VISLRVQTRNGLAKRIDIGYPPEDIETQTEEREFPIHQYIRTITFFGQIVSKSQTDRDEPEPASPSSEKFNGGEPMYEKNGSNYIIPENIKSNQCIQLTGLMFDIVV
jgi:hypothetical protein